MKPWFHKILPHARKASCLALGTLLLTAWLAPAASACGNCPDSPHAEASCCAEPAAPPPCACEAHPMGMPLPVEDPECCPCGYQQQAPAESSAVAAGFVQPTVNPAVPLPPRTALAAHAATGKPVTSLVTPARPPAIPAYLLDCALLR